MVISTRSRSIPNTIKRWLATATDSLGVCSAGLALQQRLYGPYIRAVNYHTVRPDETENFERQLEWYSRKFISVGFEDLKKFLAGETWPHDRPGILISFDDGTRDHIEIVAPLLEKHGFTGWFFVSTGRVEPDESDRTNGGANLTISEVQRLAEDHVVGSHGVDHIRLSPEVPSEVLAYEISNSKLQLQSILGAEVEVFCWIGGEVWAYCETASDLVRNHYRYAFMGNSDVILQSGDPFQLSRSNIEAENPMSLVRFQLSGLVDLYFTPRRLRVLRTTRRPAHVAS